MATILTYVLVVIAVMGHRPAAVLQLCLVASAGHVVHEDWQVRVGRQAAGCHPGGSPGQTQLPTHEVYGIQMECIGNTQIEQ